MHDSIERLAGGTSRGRGHAFRSWDADWPTSYARAKDWQATEADRDGLSPHDPADLAGRLIQMAEGKVRWKLV
jgi:hypothetical protein